ncbi:hypothetical protein EHF33_04295 [Deinococcus psychrotolerans]|uniref:Uncharacterized protein n=1 Tax=Deinococcus psychrotolerans TaxID=2489213 RepID=A0A3G8YLR3_9DEIO|nr:hypothetical protein [Deinococcus psychrotolerans]AZI42066.1 hypothetical protein EHF33_04295 [Deinococcus psychrotolerans]
MGLSDDPFTFQATKDGRLRISRGLNVVTVLGGQRAEKLLQALSAAEDIDAQQQLLARATGNYRRGNVNAKLQGGS